MVHYGNGTYFPTLGDGVWLLVLVGTHAEVLDGLTGVPLPAEEDGVRTGGRTKRELVEGENLTAGFQDTLPCRGGEPKGGNRELGDLKQTNIIRYGANSDNDLGVAVRRTLGLLDDAREGDRGAVGLGEEKAVEDRLNRSKASSPLHLRISSNTNDLVERRVRAAGEEAVELIHSTCFRNTIRSAN